MTLKGIENNISSCAVGKVLKSTAGTSRKIDAVLYGHSTKLATENFPISGIRLPEEFIATLADTKAACAQANRELGKLDDSIADRIIDAAKRISGGECIEQFPIDIFQTGSGTSTNMNMNEVLATLAGEGVHPNDHVNMGQSSNDVFPTALHVCAAVQLKERLIPALQGLWETLVRKSDEFAKDIKTGRTHLMDATPLTLGQEFSGYARQIALSMKRIEGVLPQLMELPIGGTAVGTGINTHPQFAQKVCEKLSKRFSLPFTEAKNHFEANASRDACVQTSGTLKTVAVSLHKIADDIRWMSSGPRAGLNELTLPSLQPGSSIMPGKLNPVLCESMLQVCAQVMGHDTTITQAGLLGSFELNTGMPVIAWNLLQSVRILTNCLRLFDEKCVRGIQVNRDHLSSSLEHSLMLVTRLSPIIGYDRAESLAKKARDEGRTIREVAIEEGLDEEQLSSALDPRNMLQPGE